MDELGIFIITIIVLIASFALFHWWGFLVAPIASVIVVVIIWALSDWLEGPEGVSEQEKKDMLNSDTGDFASQLRRHTATKNDLERAQEDSIRRQIQSNVDTVLKNVKHDAMIAAERKGKRTLIGKYSIYTYEGGTSYGERRIVEETVQDLTSRLISEGFRSVNVRHSKDSAGGICVSVSVAW